MRNLLRFCALLCALALCACALAEDVDLLTVDHRLYELGYRDAACSGELDDVMVNALRNFQRANGLGVTGEPDAGTMLILLSGEAVSQEEYLTRVAQESYGMIELTAGDFGDAVLRLQRSLRELGYFEDDGDGVYRDNTVEAVCRFQLANGLRLTGTADGAVFVRLYGEGAPSWSDFLRRSAAGVGDSGEAVRQLQRCLACKGYFEGECTGRYGESTQRAVRQFQTSVGLEASGDANLETCRALYGNVSALMAEEAVLRPGEPDAQALGEGLQALGYAAHAEFDMQTELALMEFQQANSLPVTGMADAETMARLGAPDAVGRAGFVAAGTEVAASEDFASRVARQAAHLLGQASGLEDEFSLVQYVYLKCGVAAADRDQFTQVSDDLSQAAPGDMLVLTLADGERCGLVASDGALIYRDGEGYIVMGYPAVMGVVSARLYRLSA